MRSCLKNQTVRENQSCRFKEPASEYVPGSYILLKCFTFHFYQRKGFKDHLRSFLTSIRPSSKPLILLRVAEGDSSCQWAKGAVLPRHIASLCQGWRIETDNHSLFTFTLTVKVNLTACLLIIWGNQSTWRKPAQAQGEHAHRKALVGLKTKNVMCLESSYPKTDLWQGEVIL